MLVNIGSGVSILQIIGPSKYKRVAGTMIGGGTLLGLARLLIGVSDFDSIVELSKKGSMENVDLLIKDIYHNTEDEQGDLPASSFGKVCGTEAPARKEDIARSLIAMIVHNIAQMSVLVAKRVEVERYLWI